MSGDRLFMLAEHELVAIVSLALDNPIRTIDQQAALVGVCKTLDNPMVQWSHDAGATWEGRRCQCGRAIPVMAHACGLCSPIGATS